ncbi:tetratricopeptide repeat protein [Streptomyces scabiei]|nr:tetratricopeptide repeat protein [Streptomyces scabiei]
MSEGAAEASGERAVAAGRDIGNAATGDFVTQIARATVLPAEAFSLDPCASRVRHLPDRTGQFVGRERELRLLDQTFGETGGVVVHAVHGLGGIGKSTLAAHWAAARAVDFNPVWWITAETESDLDAGLAALGRALQPALVGILTEEALRERTIQWLASNEGWLVVLDNVSDPAVIKPLLARAPSGRLLVTTRRGPASWRGIARTLDLDVLAPNEAVELFTGTYGGPADGVEELCAELGCLPLAVDQAAAYCREAGVTPRAYLDLLARYPADMYAATVEGEDAQRTVARVWQVTLDALADTPAAAAILRLIAWWAPDDIPRTYLTGIGGPLEVTEAVRRLAAHSMIKMRGELLSVHRLVQAVSRAGGPQEVVAARDAAVTVLVERQPEAIIANAAARLWATHAEALGGCLEEEYDTELLTILLVRAGAGFAREHPRRSVELADRVSRSLARHAEWVSADSTYDALLALYVLNGERARGIPLAERQFTLRQSTLGDAHPQTITSLISLARAVRHTDPQRALALAEQAVETASEALGTEHRLTFNAETALRDIAQQPPDLPTLESRLRKAHGLFGEGDLENISLESDLVDALAEAGELDKAAALAERVVARCRAIFGDTDSLTLNYRLRHVHLLVDLGETVRVMELLLPLLTDLERRVDDIPGTRSQMSWVLALIERLSGRSVPDEE